MIKDRDFCFGIKFGFRGINVLFMIYENVFQFYCNSSFSFGNKIFFQFLNYYVLICYVYFLVLLEGYKFGKIFFDIS